MNHILNVANVFLFNCFTYIPFFYGSPHQYLQIISLKILFSIQSLLAGISAK